MTDRDLDGWATYAKVKGLPQKRAELYLAQVAQTQGGGKLEAYLLRPVDKAAEEEPTATLGDLAKVGGANVHVIRIAKG